MASDKTASETVLIFSNTRRNWRHNPPLAVRSLQTPPEVRRRWIEKQSSSARPLPRSAFLPLVSSVVIVIVKEQNTEKKKKKAKQINKQRSQAPVLLARLQISIHLKLTSCWAVLEQSIRCNRSSPPVCLLLSLIWNVINERVHCDLLGLVIKASLHGV